MSPSLIDVRTAGGHAWRLTVRAVPVQAPRAGLLWLPALGVAAEKYARFAEALAQRGIAVFVHEWRGTGSSSARAARGSDWGYRQLLEEDLPASHAAAMASTPNLRWLLGGHSLGGQLAALHATRSEKPVAGLVLVATGLPHAATFSGRQRWGVSVFARALPALTRIVGHYPGERLGFAGREAGQLMRDWASTVVSGRYRGFGLLEDHEAALAALDLPILGVRMENDWLAPDASLQALLAKLGRGPRRVEVLGDADLGDRADHFRWLRAPSAVANRISDWLDPALT